MLMLLPNKYHLHCAFALLLHSVAVAHRIPYLHCPFALLLHSFAVAYRIPYLHCAFDLLLHSFAVAYRVPYLHCAFSLSTCSVAGMVPLQTAGEARQAAREEELLSLEGNIGRPEGLVAVKV